MCIYVREVRLIVNEEEFHRACAMTLSDDPAEPALRPAVNVRLIADLVEKLPNLRSVDLHNVEFSEVQTPLSMVDYTPMPPCSRLHRLSIQHAHSYDHPRDILDILRFLALDILEIYDICPDIEDEDVLPPLPPPAGAELSIKALRIGWNRGAMTTPILRYLCLVPPMHSLTSLAMFCTVTDDVIYLGKFLSISAANLKDITLVIDYPIIESSLRLSTSSNNSNHSLIWQHLNLSACPSLQHLTIQGNSSTNHVGEHWRAFVDVLSCQLPHLTTPHLHSLRIELPIVVHGMKSFLWHIRRLEWDSMSKVLIDFVGEGALTRTVVQLNISPMGANVRVIKGDNRKKRLLERKLGRIYSKGFLKIL